MTEQNLKCLYKVTMIGEQTDGQTKKRLIGAHAFALPIN